MEGYHLRQDQYQKGLEVEHPRMVTSYEKRGEYEVGKSV